MESSIVRSSPKPKLWTKRTIIAVIVGLLLAVVCQRSTVTTPEYESILARVQLAQLLDKAAPGLFPEAAKQREATVYRQPMAWEGSVVLPLPGWYFLGIAALTIAFSLLRPLWRFLLWAGIVGVITWGSAYAYLSANLLWPLGGVLLMVHCSFACATVIFLETERIERARQMALALQVHAEQERQRIATDLHDETLPALSRVMRLADQMQSKLPGDSLPQEMRTQLEQTAVEMRRILDDLHPTVLEKLGLGAALEHLALSFSRSSGIPAKLVNDVANNDLPLQPFESLSLFRIAQEALNNVEKHASASNVELNLSRNGDAVTLEISDDGIGFPAGTKRREGRGLTNIEQRASLIDAKVTWRKPTNFPQGTAVVVTLQASDAAKMDALKS